MTDYTDLKRRLGWLGGDARATHNAATCAEAAAAIAALEAERDALRARIVDWEARIDDCEWSSNSSLTEGIRAEMRALTAITPQAPDAPAPP